MSADWLTGGGSARRGHGEREPLRPALHGFQEVQAIVVVWRILATACGLVVSTVSLARTS